MQLVIICNTGFCRWIPKSNLDVGWRGRMTKNVKLSFELQ